MIRDVIIHDIGLDPLFQINSRNDAVIHCTVIGEKPTMLNLTRWQNAHQVVFSRGSDRPIADPSRAM